eukprot:TRINITY_DN1948_c0_g1_i1.p1 TRINITY_DN1948_c0_g1~~TRINITY_DN1948_c0_g1_i1.p1  ORF type:complete len:360 (-),score=25.91 TRINITY_DN1948_c0_g1_i1:51-1130(-)
MWGVNGMPPILSCWNIVHCILLLLLVQCAQGQWKTLQTTNVRYDFPQGTYDSGCQACPQYYTIRNGRRSGYFGLGFEDARERNATGGLCCGLEGYSACVPNVGCNQHVIYSFGSDFYNSTFNSSAASFSANFSGDYPVRACGAQFALNKMCAFFDVQYQAFSDATEITLPGGIKYTTQKDSLLGRWKISKWMTFAQNSTGLEMRVTFGAYYRLATNWQTSQPDSASGNAFTALNFEDTAGNKAAVKFLTQCVVDETTAADVTLQGPYVAAAAEYWRAVGFDVPRFDKSIEIYFNLWLPDAEPAKTSTNPLDGPNVFNSSSFPTDLILVIVFFAVSILLIGVSTAYFVHRWRHHHRRRFR